MKYFIEVSFENGEIKIFEVDNHSFESRPPWELYKFGDTTYDINYQKVNYITKYKSDAEILTTEEAIIKLENEIRK